MSAPNIDTLLAGLDKVSKVGSGWKACCPAHDDHKPSLSLRESRRGRILVRCRSGCSQDEVIGALRAMGLWGTPGDRTMRPVVRRDVSPDLEEQQRDSRRMRHAREMYENAGRIEDFPDLIAYIQSRGLDPAFLNVSGVRAARIPRAKFGEGDTPPGWIAGEKASALLYPIYHPDDILKAGKRRQIGTQREWPWGRDGGPRSVKASLGKTHAPDKAGGGGFLIGTLTPTPGTRLEIVEGQLTGFGVHQITQGQPTLVLFSVGAMAAIGAGTIRDIATWGASVRIAADADPSRAGEVGAEKCAAAIQIAAPQIPVMISIPEGEKVDWLDALVEHGPEATAWLLAARERAPTPPTPPRPGKRKCNDDFLAEPDLSGGPLGPEPPPIGSNILSFVPWERIERKPREPEQSLEEAERSVLSAVRAWAGAATPVPTIVRVTPGVGKTHQMIETVRASEQPFLILCPTLDQAREVAAQIPGARLHKGRDGDNCKQFVTVSALTERRRAPHAHACLTCEHGAVDSEDPCAYMPALRASVYSRVVVAAHGAGAEDSLLYSYCPDPAGDANTLTDRRIACDESPAVNIETKIEAGHITEWRAGVARAEALLDAEEARIAGEIALAERFGQDTANTQGRLRALEKARAWVRAIAPELDRLALALAAAAADRGLHPMTGLESFVKLAAKVPPGARHIDATLIESVNLRHAQAPIIPLKAVEILGAALANGTAFFEQGAVVCMTTGALWKQIVVRGGLLLDATPSARQVAEVEAVGGVVVTVCAAQPQLRIIQYGPRLHGRGGLIGGALTREAEIVRQHADEGAVVITHKPITQEVGIPRAGHWGRHHKAHNDWKDEDRLVLYGLPLLSPRDQQLQYLSDRVALTAVEVEWAGWDGSASAGQIVETDGWRVRPAARLPTEPQARAWLLDRLAADVAQGVGRLRAVRRSSPVTVEIYGLLPLVGHGLHVNEIRLESQGRLHNRTRARAVIAQGVADLGEARTRAKLVEYFQRKTGVRISNGDADKLVAELKTQAIMSGVTLNAAARQSCAINTRLLTAGHEPQAIAQAAREIGGLPGVVAVADLLDQCRRAPGAQRAGP